MHIVEQSILKSRLKIKIRLYEPFALYDVENQQYQQFRMAAKQPIYVCKIKNVNKEFKTLSVQRRLKGMKGGF